MNLATLKKMDAVRTGKTPFPLNQKNVIYFGYARTALEYGYHFLGLKSGDEILYPDYICDVCFLPAKKL